MLRSPSPRVRRLLILLVILAMLVPVLRSLHRDDRDSEITLRTRDRIPSRRPPDGTDARPGPIGGRVPTDDARGGVPMTVETDDMAGDDLPITVPDPNPSTTAPSHEDPPAGPEPTNPAGRATTAPSSGGSGAPSSTGSPPGGTGSSEPGSPGDGGANGSGPSSSGSVPAPGGSSAPIRGPEPEGVSASPMTVETEADRRARACAELGHLAIGATRSTDTDPILRSTASRFAALATTTEPLPDEDWNLDDVLVCGAPIERFRNDLVVQPLYAGGIDQGVLVAGLDPTDPVMRLTPMEWRSLRWTAPGAGDDWNVLGVPLRRQTTHGLETIRTTRGALVMVRPDTPGIPVIAGAWTLWERDGARMGRPASVPWGHGVGGRQAFETGLLELRGVTTAFEAMAADEGRYRWIPLAEAGLGEPPEPNSVIEVAGSSYYVSRAGQIHWIATQGQWNCARWDLRARIVPGQTDVGVLALRPPGPIFACSDWR